MSFRFEGLKIWHQARDFSNRVYRIVSGFPNHERFGLASQMTRAANSVSLNIAEGSGRDTDVDFSRFLGIAIGSVFEVVSASFLALDRGYIGDETHRRLYSQAEQLGKNINSFRRTLHRKP
jgi:four helix bundle protein